MGTYWLGPEIPGAVVSGGDGGRAVEWMPTTVSRWERRFPAVIDGLKTVTRSSKCRTETLSSSVAFCKSFPTRRRLVSVLCPMR